MYWYEYDLQLQPRTLFCNSIGTGSLIFPNYRWRFPAANSSLQFLNNGELNPSLFIHNLKSPLFGHSFPLDSHLPRKIRFRNVLMPQFQSFSCLSSLRFGNILFLLSISRNFLIASSSTRNSFFFLLAHCVLSLDS